MSYEPKWRATAKDEVPEKLRSWLFYQASFMQRLKCCGIPDPKIIVLKHRWETPLLSERVALSIPLRLYALVREVLIQSGEHHWMYARTVFPSSTLTGRERRFLHMKDQSLGTILFQYSKLERNEFEMACLNDQSAWHQKIAKLVSIGDQSLWARRSMFTINKKNILLSEVFLPDIFQIMVDTL